MILGGSDCGDCGHGQCRIQSGSGLSSWVHVDEDLTLNLSTQVSATGVGKAIGGDLSGFFSGGTDTVSVGRRYDEYCVNPACENGQRNFQLLEQQVDHLATQLEQVENGDLEWTDTSKELQRRTAELAEGFNEFRDSVETAGETAESGLDEFDYRRLDQARNRLNDRLDGAIEATLERNNLDEKYDVSDIRDGSDVGPRRELTRTNGDAVGSSVRRIQDIVDETGELVGDAETLTRQQRDEETTGAGPGASEDPLDAGWSDEGSDRFSIDPTDYSPRCAGCNHSQVKTREVSSGWIHRSGLSGSFGASFNLAADSWDDFVQLPSVTLQEAKFGKEVETDHCCTNPDCPDGHRTLQDLQVDAQELTSKLESVEAGEISWDDISENLPRKLNDVSEGFADTMDRFEGEWEDLDFQNQQLIRSIEDEFEELDQQLDAAIEKTLEEDADLNLDTESVRDNKNQMRQFGSEVQGKQRSRQLASQLTGYEFGVPGVIQNAGEAVENVRSAGESLGREQKVEGSNPKRLESDSTEEPSQEDSGQSERDSIGRGEGGDPGTPSSSDEADADQDDGESPGTQADRAGTAEDADGTEEASQPDSAATQESADRDTEIQRPPEANSSEDSMLNGESQTSFTQDHSDDLAEDGGSVREQASSNEPTTSRLNSEEPSSTQNTDDEQRARSEESTNAPDNTPSADDGERHNAATDTEDSEAIPSEDNSEVDHREQANSPSQSPGSSEASVEDQSPDGSASDTDANETDSVSLDSPDSTDQQSRDEPLDEETTEQTQSDEFTLKPGSSSANASDTSDSTGETSDRDDVERDTADDESYTLRPENGSVTDSSPDEGTKTGSDSEKEDESEGIGFW